MKRYYPCDEEDYKGKHHCPYVEDENSYVSCRDMCGLGVDENSYYDNEEEEG